MKLVLKHLMAIASIDTAKPADVENNGDAAVAPLDRQPPPDTQAPARGAVAAPEDAASGYSSRGDTACGFTGPAERRPRLKCLRCTRACWAASDIAEAARSLTALSKK